MSLCKKTWSSKHEIPGVALLGATGSIGKSTCSVLSENRDKFRCVAMASQFNRVSLDEAANFLSCKKTVLTSETGNQALTDLAISDDVDIVVVAMTGVVGVEPVLAALQAGKRVALASKEVLVMAGDMVMNVAANAPGELLPVDSEHSALFQCLQGRSDNEVEKLIITASGGPFRTWSSERIASATPQEALAHPTWSMGRKISIDSASLMNKALELIEAHHLFCVPEDKLDVLVNHQSLLHALVELKDGTNLLCCSAPDMRLAIQYALSFPNRLPISVKHLDLAKVGLLNFEVPDHKRFPSLEFAREALRRGGAIPAILNAANDVAVAAFLAERISFPAIWRVVENALEHSIAEKYSSLLELQQIDAAARCQAEDFILAIS